MDVGYQDRNSDPQKRGDSGVAELADRQHGLVSYEQAIACALSRRAITARIAAGRWERVHPRVYRIAGARSERQPYLAATLWAGERAYVSHRSAGILHELDGVWARKIDVTVGRELDRRSSKVAVHRALELRDRDVTVLDGIPITTAARTVVDLAAVVPAALFERALEDAFRRRLTTPEDVDATLWRVGGRGRKGTKLLRDLLDDRGASSDSGWEVRLRRLLVDRGLPAPDSQHAVVIDGQRYRLDLAYPAQRVDVEFESLRWHTGRERLEVDSERRNRLRAAGWRIVHVTAGMLRDRPEQVVRDVSNALSVDLSYRDRN